MSLDVLCIGSSRFDVFISGKGLKPDKFSLENKIELKNDSSYEIEHAIYEAGGSALNSSVLFARQGIKAGCLSMTGKDHLANQIKIIAKHEGVEINNIISRTQHHTDLSIHIITDRAHEVNLSYNRSSFYMRSKDTKLPNLRTNLIYFAELPDDFKTFKYYVNWAKINKSELYINIKDFKNYKKRQINFVLSNSQKVFIPLILAEAYFGGEISPEGIIRNLCGIGAKSVVLYDVISNSYAYEDETIYICSTYKKINPLDMTGSEDVFAAGYISAIINNKNIPEALTMASANACAVMEIFGTRIAILKKPALRTIKVETKTL